MVSGWNRGHRHIIIRVLVSDELMILSTESGTRMFMRLHKLLLCIVFPVFTVLAASGVSHAQSTNLDNTAPQNFLVLGALTGKADALDPNNPDNVLRYRNNFRDILAISYSDLPEHSPSGARRLEQAFDFGEAFLNLGGINTERVIGELLPLRDRRMDVLIVYSWGAAAVMAAFDQGFIRQPPRQLVVVGPPQLTPAGGELWRRLADRYPQMSIDVYIARNDILQRFRETVPRVVHAMLKRLPPSEEEIASAVLSYFTARRVKVHTYHTPPGGSIDAHAIHHFLDFAAARNLYGLRQGPPVVSQETVQDNTGDDEFAVSIHQTTARVAAIDELAQRQTMNLREVQARDEARMRETERLMWRYFASLVESACADAPPSDPWSDGVIFSYTELREWGRTGRGELSDCGRALLDGVLGAGRPVTFGWVRAEAGRYLARVAEETRRREQAARREAERRRAAEARERASGAMSTSGSSRTESTDRDRAIRTPDIENTSGMRDARGVKSNLGRWDGQQR